MEQKEKFYKKEWFMWLMLVLITPIGLIMLWKNKKHGAKTKWIAAAIFSVWFIIMAIVSQPTEAEVAEREAKQEQIKQEREEKKVAKEEEKAKKDAEEKKEEEEAKDKGSEEKQESSKKEEKKEDAELTQDEKIKQKITDLVEKERVIKINKIEVVENHADDADGGYNALVHLVFDVKNRAKTAKGAINANTDSLGSSLAGTDDLENVTFFWEVPYLLEGNNIIKINAEQKDGKMYRVDEWFDGRIFE